MNARRRGACLVVAAMVAQSIIAQAPARRTPPPRFTFAAAGDLLGPYRHTLALDGAFAEVVALIRQADAAFANQEGASFDSATFRGWLGAENGGGYPLHTPAVARAFKAVGLDLISRANNHGTDWGLEGLYASDSLLDRIGLTHAGTGRSLDAARAPAYFTSPHGRVALIAAASTFTPMSPAGNPGRGAGPRPGINPLHVTPVTLVTAAEMESLRQISLRGGWQGNPPPAPDVAELRIGDAVYRRSPKPGLTYQVSDDDRRAIIASVSTARTKADFVAFSIHAHETSTGGYDDPVPADFLPSFFHDLIDAGADVVVRHGPHSVMGIEIYHGKPIFYGLASLFFDLDRTIRVASEGPAESRQSIALPDEWYESALAVSEYADGRVRRIRIYPLVFDAAPATRGVPHLATGSDARRILERIRDRSMMFGTAVTIDGAVGLIEIVAP